MKQIEVDELRENPVIYLKGPEPLAIEYQGEVLGLYYPKKRSKPEEVKLAIEHLEREIDRVLAQTGMTEDELADLFDLTKPFSYDVTDH
jgi:hypothetical protein